MKVVSELCRALRRVVQPGTEVRKRRKKRSHIPTLESLETRAVLSAVPVIAANGLADVTMNEDAANRVINLNNVFSDSDGDDLTFTSTNTRDDAGHGPLVDVTFNQDTGRMTLDLVDGAFGVTEITVTADDGNGGSVSDTMTLIVTGDGDGSDTPRHGNSANFRPNYIRGTQEVLLINVYDTTHPLETIDTTDGRRIDGDDDGPWDAQETAHWNLVVEKIGDMLSSASGGQMDMDVTRRQVDYDYNAGDGRPTLNAANATDFRPTTLQMLEDDEAGFDRQDYDLIIWDHSSSGSSEANDNASWFRHDWGTNIQLLPIQLPAPWRVGVTFHELVSHHLRNAGGGLDGGGHEAFYRNNGHGRNANDAHNLKAYNHTTDSWVDYDLDDVDDVFVSGFDHYREEYGNKIDPIGNAEIPEDSDESVAHPSVWMKLDSNWLPERTVPDLEELGEGLHRIYAHNGIEVDTPNNVNNGGYIAQSEYDPTLKYGVKFERTGERLDYATNTWTEEEQELILEYRIGDATEDGLMLTINDEGYDLNPSKAYKPLDIVNDNDRGDGVVVLDGAFHSVRIPNSADFQNGPEKTYSFAFNADNAPDDEIQVLMDVGENGGRGGFASYLVGDRLYVQMSRDLTVQRIIDLGQIETGQWYDVAMVFEDDPINVGEFSRFHGYLDGQLIETQDVFRLPSPIGGGQAPTLGDVGGTMRYADNAILNEVDDAEYSFRGRIDDFRVYTTALTANQVGVLDDGVGAGEEEPDSANLVADLTFDIDGRDSSPSGADNKADLLPVSWNKSFQDTYVTLDVGRQMDDANVYLSIAAGGNASEITDATRAPTDPAELRPQSWTIEPMNTGSDRFGDYIDVQFSLTDNTAPTVSDSIDNVSVEESDDGSTANTVIDLSDHFTDTVGGTLTYSAKATDDTSLFTVSVNNSNLTLDYADGLTGESTVEVTATDGIIAVTETFTVTVGGDDDNTAPVASDDTGTVAVGGTVDINVVTNDTDADGDDLSVTAVTNGDNGTVAINANGTVRYTSTGTAAGADSFTYTVSDGEGGEDTGTVNITINAAAGGQGPYGGANRTMEDDSRIELEDFDTGGEGVAYHDTTARNRGNAYRTAQGVDIRTTTDTDTGGHIIGWLVAGEWLEYTVDVTAGTYDINLRYATNNRNPGDLAVSLDDTALGTFDIARTGGNAVWDTLTLEGVAISDDDAGDDQILRLDVVDRGSFNINWIEFVETGGGGDDNELVAQLTFDAGNANDTSPDGDTHNGRLVAGASTTNDADQGTVLSLDGTNDRVVIRNADDINLETQDERTVSLLFRADDTTGTQILYEEGGNGRGLNIYIDDGNLYVGAWGMTDAANIFLSTAIADDDDWHHVALVLDGPNGTFAGYLDGTQFATGDGGSIARHGGGTAIGNVAGSTRTHEGNTRGGGNAFGGLIDDVRIYNSVLDDDEIGDLF